MTVSGVCNIYFFFIFFFFAGTVRRFLENHGKSIEMVVFAVTDMEEVCSYILLHIPSMFYTFLGLCARKCTGLFLGQPTFSGV